MGEVYRARDPRLDRQVAVKVLPAEMASSPDRLARFEHEARAVAGLNHPNIVTLHSVESDGDVRFLTMELVEGQNLSDLVASGGLPLQRILELAIPLTDALVAAHERGVVHLDLKPANVMVTREGRVKVLDFGLAKIAAKEARPEAVTLAVDNPMSGEGQVFGTVPYMAPEQIRGEPVDARTDLFALGIILYELAAGHRPFRGKTPADVTSGILRDKPEPLGGIRSDLPADFERIVSRCLEKSPRDRFQTALEVSNELRALRRTLERGVPERPANGKVATIAVLPFVNRSASADDQYFSDGLADELLNVLAKIKGLRVSARASSFYFKGKDVPLAEIGKALNVATLLDGSVRKSGDRVRISVQLVQVSDGYHLWSETYDRTLDDIFAVQDDIAQSVVKELRSKLLGEEADSDGSVQAKAEVAKAAKGRGTNPEAHRLFLLGRHLVGLLTREDTAKGIGYLKRALDLDPKLALAWSELSRAYSNQAGLGWDAVADGYRRSREAAEQALALEPDLSEAHARLGWIRMVYDWDRRGAEASFHRALELAPGNSLALRMSGVLAEELGRFEEAIEFFRRALEQDPLSAPAYHTFGLTLHGAESYTEAEEVYRKALELAPQRATTRANLSLTLLALGRADEAIAEALREPDEALRLWALAIIHHAQGQRAESDEALRVLIEKHSDGAACQIAEVQGARGSVDAAFEWLERAYAQRDSGLSAIQRCPRLRSLYGDPRWSEFMKKMGYEG